MSNLRHVYRVFFVFCVSSVILWSPHGFAAQSSDTVRVAVAANFRPVLERLIEHYKTLNPQVDIVYSSGASGSLYHQIVRGAPFDIFLSADTRYPSELENHPQTFVLQRRSYALGELVLYRPDGLNNLAELAKAKRVSLANPKLAPYGRAAKEVLQQLDYIEAQQIIGQSIAQAYQYAVTRNVDAAFVAKSLVLDRPNQWVSLEGYYQPIHQQAVLLNRENTQKRMAAEAFYQFLFSASAQEIIQVHGYQLPSGKIL